MPEVHKNLFGSAPSALRILVVDDHSIVREGLALRIEAEPGIKVVGCVVDGAEAIAAVERLQPDVVIMDLVLPAINGIDATRHILGAFPQTIVIALSACHSLEHIRRTLRAGAHAFVLKSAASKELTDAVKLAAAGETYFSPAIVELHGAPALKHARHSNPIEDLSDRERQILPFLIAGMTSAQIGLELSLSCKTVETYRSRLMAKLGVSDRVGLNRVVKEYELPRGADCRSRRTRTTTTVTCLAAGGISSEVRVKQCRGAASALPRARGHNFDGLFSCRS
jgi:DNA-binding NarL/FixJ family response regulator